MLKITVPAAEFWDEIHEEFIYKKEQTLQLEHSLVSLSKWESKWNKAFLGKQEKTDEEILDYDIVNIGLHFFLKDVRPMLPPVMNHSIAVA